MRETWTAEGKDTTVRRRSFLGTLAATVAAPLAMLVPKRDVEAEAKIICREFADTHEVTRIEFVSVMDFSRRGANPVGWKVREYYSNGYSRTIWIKTMHGQFWLNRLGRPADPFNLPYKHLLAIWDFDVKRIGPGPRTFR